MNNVARHKRGIPMPDAVGRAALQSRLEQVALRQGDQWPFCPCRYLGRFCPPSADAAGDEAPEEEPAATAPEAASAEAFEPDPRKWPEAASGERPRSKRETTWASHEAVWCEWEHVRDARGNPLRASVSARDLLHHGRSVPRCPLRQGHLPRGLTFSPEFMDAVADRVHPGTRFVGIVPEGDKVAFAPKELPRGGVDIADAPVYWVFPSGHVECWSVERLAGATADELAAEEGLPEYEAVAAGRDFLYLGHAKVDAMAALQKEPGTLAERRWEQVSFQLPESALAGCWWLTNPFHRAAAHDGAEERNPEKETPVFVYRSLAILVAELHQQRVATVAKMSEELRARRERNLELAGQLSHTRLWRHHGPRRWVEGFLAAATGRGALSAAEPSAAELKELTRQWSTCVPETAGLDATAEWTATAEALADLRSTHWEDIRRERFAATPKGLFEEMRRGVVSWAEHGRACAARRDRRLLERRERRAATRPADSEAANADSDGEAEPHGERPEDAEEDADREAQTFRQGWRSAPADEPRPDDFVPKRRNLPRDHDLATDHAEELLLDAVRALLDLHYEARLREAHEHTELERLRKRAMERARGGKDEEEEEEEGDAEQIRRKNRQARSRVFAKASAALTEQRYESFVLPPEVKTLLQKPKDERSWRNAEALRDVVRRRAELEDALVLESPEDVRRLAEALAAGGAASRDVVGGRREVLVAGVSLQPGTCVSVPGASEGGGPVAPGAAARRRRGSQAAGPNVEQQVRQLQPGPAAQVRVRRRPREGEDARAVAIGELADLIWDPRPLRQAAKDWRSGRDEEEPLLVAETVDGLLTQLGLLLWHEQVERWTQQNRAWTQPDEINEATRWYLLGQRAGDKPLFDGMCSRCGDLLFGPMNQSYLAGNKKNGPPRDAEGQPWSLPPAGQCQQQPPFLLRYSPKFLAQMAPAVFDWTEETNRLALRAEHQARPPWRIRSGTRAKAALENGWLYCKPCHDSLFDEEHKPPVPLRDRASAERMRPDPKQQAREEEAAAAAAAEADQAPGQPAPADGSTPAAAAEAEARAPATGTTAEDYRADWEAKLRRFARAPGGRFGFDNLVPVPRPELWQDAPHSPVEALSSPQAQGRLSVCQLISSMEESRMNVGVATYASATGELNFRRRSGVALWGLRERFSRSGCPRGHTAAPRGQHRTALELGEGGAPGRRGRRGGRKGNHGVTRVQMG